MTVAVAGAAARSAGAGAAAKSAGTATKAAPRKAPAKKTAPLSSKGYMDAVAAGGEKKAPAAPPPEPSLIPSPPSPPEPPQWANAGAGFVLALVFWGWVALPFLKGGPGGVKSMLRAKFTNKAPDGSWLP